MFACWGGGIGLGSRYCAVAGEHAATEQREWNEGRGCISGAKCKSKAQKQKKRPNFVKDKKAGHGTSLRRNPYISPLT